MSHRLRLLTLTVIACLACCAAVAQTTAFTYQGRLTDGGTPANGDYDLLFNMWNSPSGGTLVHSQTFNNVRVTNGVFTVSLDFGASSFTGPNRFLEIGAKLVGSSSFTFVNPRQQITSTPYAIRSLSAASADSVPASGVSAGSGNYIQNSSTQQTSSNFNITGNGTAGGTLTGNVVSATLQFNLGGNRILSAGSENLFLGFEAGLANTAGIRNSFVGRFAGTANTTGNDNSFFGLRAGATTTTGSFNSFFGNYAGEFGANGSLNSFFGIRAGQRNSGSDNSFFGTLAGYLNELGSGNTFVGHFAGQSNRFGSFNTLVGDTADVTEVFPSSLTNATAIGARALVSQSNSLVLGSINGTNGATADTKVGIGTTAPAFKLEVVDPSNKGLRVQTNTAGGTVASFGSNGDFRIDRPFVAGGRFTVLENGNVGIGLSNSVTFTPPTPTFRLQVIDSSNTGLRVQNDAIGGTVASFGGNGAFQIDANGAAGGRFTVSENGNVGIGTNAPGARLHVSGGAILLDNNQGLFFKDTSGNQKRALIGDNSNILRLGSGSPTGFDEIRFDVNTSGEAMTIKGSGNVGIGTATPNDRLEVNGILRVNSLGGNGVFQVCRNVLNQIAVCASSLRYKTNINPFASGLNLVNRLFPITFDWKQGGMKDLGLGAEEVEKVEPLLVTYNSAGEVEGVKYDRVAVVLINAIKEQQTQIEEQRNQIVALRAANANLSSRLLLIEKRLRNRLSRRQK